MHLLWPSISFVVNVICMLLAELLRAATAAPTRVTAAMRREQLAEMDRQRLRLMIVSAWKSTGNLCPLFMRCCKCVPFVSWVCFAKGDRDAVEDDDDDRYRTLASGS